MREPDIHFAPTPSRVIPEMLRLAEIGPGSVVYDLGCGDGRVLIAAARDRGARGVGIDIDANRIAEGRANAIQAGVQDRVEFLQGDFFDARLSGATAIVLYLLDSLNIRLRPKILSECQPGVPIVSYSFEMGDWEADAHTPLAANGVFLWIVPARIAGPWSISAGSDSVHLESLTFQQSFQKLSAFAKFHDRPASHFQGRMTGDRFTLTALPDDGDRRLTIEGKASGERMQGSVSHGDAKAPFTLHRDPLASGER